MDRLSMKDTEVHNKAASDVDMRQIIDQAHVRLRDGDAHSALQVRSLREAG